MPTSHLAIGHCEQMSRLYRSIRKFLPATMQLAWSRSRIERSYDRDIAAAHRAKDRDWLTALESERSFELDMQDEQEDAHLTGRLLRRARRLRVPIPHRRNEDGTESHEWYVGAQTGGWYLTTIGIRALREEIRQESKARHESRAQLVVWLSVVTGMIGALTGLIAVAQRLG